jgi:glycosyltransferase involved in cell wall biosynthesis
VYGHREVAERGAGITLFASGSGSALAAAVLELLEAPERRAAVLAEAARYAEATTWEAVAAQTRQVYLLARNDWQEKQPERGRR